MYTGMFTGIGGRTKASGFGYPTTGNWSLGLMLLGFLSYVKAESCRTYQGSTSIIRTCADGCCDGGCCDNNYQNLAIILGTVFGCLLLVIAITLIVVCCSRDRWSKKFQVSPRGNIS